MDSPIRTRPAPPASADPAVEAPTSAALAEAPPGALARLGRVLAGVEAIVRFAYRVATLSAVSVGLIVLALATHTGNGPAELAAVGLLLLTPAAAVALAGWTLSDLARLPRQLKEAALEATGREPSGAAVKGSRVARLVRSLWAMRGLALLTKGGWLRAVGALRYARLASLPFALGLVAFALLNGVVILGGVAALLVLLF